jgi:hypothetical protein
MAFPPYEIRLKNAIGKFYEVIVLYCNNLLTKHVTHNINIMHNILKGQNNNVTGRSEVNH